MLEMQEDKQVNESEETANSQNGETVDTQEQTVEQKPKVDEGVEKEKDNSTPKTLTQEEVDTLLKERLQRQKRTVYERYGVNDEQGLDELVAKSQSYDVMCERLSKIKQDYAFLRNNIAEDKQEDIITYFKGKGVELNADSLKEELANHNEWVKVEPKTTTIKQIAPERKMQPDTSEKERVAKMFGLKGIL